MIKVTSLKSISNNCLKCAGECWDNNSSVRQEKALAKFGLIPNHCAPSRSTGSKCPFPGK